MLSLWKLRVGAEAYYLSQVARGLDDYYSGHGEAAGRWIGNAIPGLGLAGEVTGEDLRAVLAGLAPGSGLTPNGTQLRAHRRRVPGFDLTFAVPKSVSVVYALGDPYVQGMVLEAGHAAVAEALAWLEREACHVRRGTNNRAARTLAVAEWGTRRLPGAGFVAAEFRHRTSRAGDPHLHWHVLVANLTRGPDGRWSALDATGLYRSKRAAGVVFQTVLRRELTERLGLEWLAPHRDAAEIAGVPRRVCRWFSKRRDEIEHELARLGADGPAAADAAMLATRCARMEIDGEALDAGWKAEAADLGWGPVELDRLLAGTTAPAPSAGDELIGTDRGTLARDVGRRLTETTGVFTRHQVTQTVASLTPGASAATIDRYTSFVLADEEIVPLPTSAPAQDRPAGWEQRFTTRTLLEIEQRLLGHLAHGHDGGCGALPATIVDTAVAGCPALGDDQRDAVVRLTSQGNAVEVLVGRAGTGKTYTLACVADAYRTAGWQVVGVAPSARAARELEHSAGITSHTVPRFHRHTERQPLDAQTLVVVDEAGMCGTVDLTSILDASRAAGAKVILVGDHHQLPEVGAGGGFAAAVEAAGSEVCELTVNRRQHQPWEIAALDELRHGDIPAAWAAYVAHDRVVLIDDRIELHERAVDDWWDAHQTGRHALLLAGTRSEAAALNRHARQRVAAAGMITGPTLTVGDRAFQVGDRILCTRNSPDAHTLDGHAASVDNGTLATITAIHRDTRAIDITVLGSGRQLRLDADYLDAGWVEHGYAMTIHKSQGATCDDVLVAGPTGLYREAAYVAMSRARHGARLYATSRQAADLETGSHTSGIPLPDDTGNDAEAELLDRLHRSQAKTLATYLLHPDALTINALAALPLDELEARLVHVREVEHDALAAGLADPDAAQASHERAVHARTHLDSGRRVRALDWDNVGTVQSLDDTRGSAVVRFLADNGDSAMRTLPWHQLLPIDHPPAVDLTPAASQWLRLDAANMCAAAAAWNDRLARDGVHDGEGRRLTTAIEIRQQRLAHQVHALSPGWLTWWLGPRPEDATGANVWDETIARIAAWRDRHHVDHEIAGLGPQPREARLAEDWIVEMTELLATRTWLTSRQSSPLPSPVVALTREQVYGRLDELDALMTSAPADQSRIIADLVDGTLPVDDLHDALVHAHELQGERRDWILTNWPYVVEREQLQRIADQWGPLGRWEPPPSPAVLAALDRLAALVPPPAQREESRLAELHRQLDELDPGKRLAELTQQLVTVRDRIAELSEGRPAVPPGRADLMDAEHTVLADRCDALVQEVALERKRLADSRLVRQDAGAELRAAIAARQATLLHDASRKRPRWLINRLTEWDALGILEQVSDSHVMLDVASTVRYRDRWGIRGDDPLGPAPMPDTVQFTQWTEAAPNSASAVLDLRR